MGGKSKSLEKSCYSCKNFHSCDHVGMPDDDFECHEDLIVRDEGKKKSKVEYRTIDTDTDTDVTLKWGPITSGSTGADGSVLKTKEGDLSWDIGSTEFRTVDTVLGDVKLSGKRVIIEPEEGISFGKGDSEIDLDKIKSFDEFRGLLKYMDIKFFVDRMKDGAKWSKYLK